MERGGLERHVRDRVEPPPPLPGDGAVNPYKESLVVGFTLADTQRDGPLAFFDSLADAANEPDARCVAMREVMRTALALLLLGACSKATPDHSEPPPPPPGPITPHIDAGAADATTDAPSDATTSRAPTPIKPLAMAGPFQTLDASCAAARPCGFTEMIDSGTYSKPPKTPACDAVIDQSRDPISQVPTTINRAGTAELSRLVGKDHDEIRIGGVRCAEPKGMRGESSEHYVFVHRNDGWWRTQQPMMSWSYNEKYCGGGMYVMWNDRGPRTIIGIAAGHNCLTCGKQGYNESITELMVRVETGGERPLVFAPLVVGTRDKTWRMEELARPDVDPRQLNEPDCKLGASATSLTESWPSDDEVILAGGTGTGGPVETTIEIGVDAPLAAPGRYRFAR
jgi:hypothetical protein